MSALCPPHPPCPRSSSTQGFQSLHLFSGSQNAWTIILLYFPELLNSSWVLTSSLGQSASDSCICPWPGWNFCPGRITITVFPDSQFFPRSFLQLTTMTCQAAFFFSPLLSFLLANQSSPVSVLIIQCFVVFSFSLRSGLPCGATSPTHLFYSDPGQTKTFAQVTERLFHHLEEGSPRSLHTEVVSFRGSHV